MSWRYWLALLSLLAACRIDQLESVSEVGSASELELLREPEAPPPGVRARLALSEFAGAHFVELELWVTVEAGQSFAGQGLTAEWIEGAEGGSESADFTAPLWNQLTLSARSSALACDVGSCSVVLEVLPRGTWQSDVPYPVRYRSGANLRLERRERLPIDSDLDLRLELLP